MEVFFGWLAVGGYFSWAGRSGWVRVGMGEHYLWVGGVESLVLV